ncbi:MAG: two-component sensor histidine kinase [Burkholderiales bacterium RIFCSPHIGHO2_12_FULL_61_11]|nr:MAG: two-component sensor histidine kinase [Burkholderiales bacterium RIFCSPHIGHO2_12_FULL_61_11]
MPTEVSTGALKHRPASLAFRVTAFVGIATTLVFFAFGWIVVRSLEQHFAQQDAEEFRVVLESIQKTLRDQPAGTDDAVLDRLLASSVVGHQEVFFRVTDAAGKTLYASDGPDLARLAVAVEAVPRIDPEFLQVWQEGETPYRGAVLRVEVKRISGPESYTVVVATNIDFHLRYIKNFERTLWLMTLVVCLIALAGAWLAVKQGHAPIRRISAKIRGITSERLHVRLRPEAVPIELAELVASFNSMLGQIEDGFRRLSNFSADIAHELRTPVTNLTTQTQVALSRPRGVDEYREILYSNLEEFDRMSKMVDDMLFLAQTENDLRRLTLADVDLAGEVKGLFEFFEAWAEDRGVSLLLRGDPIVVPGDRLMLRRALSNLISNAVRYTPSGQGVVVTLAQNADGVELEVENPGPEIPAELMPKLFDRFYRVDPSRQRKGEGAGLGLAIVKSIVEAHGGSISVKSASGRTRFCITLPKR